MVNKMAFLTQVHYFISHLMYLPNLGDPGIPGQPGDPGAGGPVGKLCVNRCLSLKLYVETLFVLSFNYSMNGFIITWILHQVIMYSIIVKLVAS